MYNYYATKFSPVNSKEIRFRRKPAHRFGTVRFTVGAPVFKAAPRNCAVLPSQKTQSKHCRLPLTKCRTYDINLPTY